MLRFVGLLIAGMRYASCITFFLPCLCAPPGLQVQDAVDRLLAFGPVHSTLETAKPSLTAVSPQHTLC